MIFSNALEVSATGPGGDFRLLAIFFAVLAAVSLAFGAQFQNEAVTGSREKKPGVPKKTQGLSFSKAAGFSGEKTAVVIGHCVYGTRNYSSACSSFLGSANSGSANRRNCFGYHIFT